MRPLPGDRQLWGIWPPRTDQLLSKEQVSLMAVSGETCPEPTSIWTKCAHCVITATATARTFSSSQTGSLPPLNGPLLPQRLAPSIYPLS